MILTIPYNPSLPGGYDRLASAILRYGRHPNHTLFVTALPQHEDGAFELAMKLKDNFGRYFAVTIPPSQLPENGIQASNRAFVTAMDALRSYEPTATEMQEPVMLYFDPMWRPTKTRWLDEFQAEYYLAGAPVTYGCFSRDRGKARINGPVAISRKFLKETKLMEFMTGDTHWRDFLAWEIINLGLQAEALGRVLPAYIRPYDP